MQKKANRSVPQRSFTKTAIAAKILKLKCCPFWSVPLNFATMTIRWKAVVALALVFLAVALNVSAGEQLTRGQTALKTTSLSGQTTFLNTPRAQRFRSGIAGQVLLIVPTLSGLNLDEGLGDYVVPVQLHLWVYAKTGRSFRHIGSIETAQDGSFSFDAPPGTYMLEPDPTSEYSLGGVFGDYTDTLEITVFPRQISYDEIYVVSAISSLFP